LINLDLRDHGWIWEGQGLDPGVYPSIFGVGEGAEYFGLRKVCYMFHPNDELAMKKLSHLEEVVCDISKWRFKRTEGGTANWADSSPDSVKSEARKVSALSTRYPNVKAAIHDDMKGLVEKEGFGPERYAEVYGALRSANPGLKLWSVVYSHELDGGYWRGFMPYIDVVNLWVWNARDLTGLDEYIERTREIFARKPIVVGCYLRNYPERSPVPMDMLKHQWNVVKSAIEDGRILGFSILGTVLIDGHQEQANWIRDFIARS